MGRLGRDVYRKKLERYLSHSFDEPIISLVSALVAAQSGSQNARAMIQDLPPEAVGAELGSPYHIPLWSVETLVNELLAIPKAKGFGIGRTRVLNAEMFQIGRALQGLLITLDKADRKSVGSGK